MTQTQWFSLGARVEASGIPTGLNTALRHWWASAPPATAISARTILLQVADLPAVPAGAQAGRLPGLRQPLQVRTDQQRVWIEGQIYLDVGPERAEITVGPQGADFESWMAAFVEAHRVAGWLPLHAACVGQNGKAAVMVGVSGAGKSTAALRLGQQGFQVLAEDRVWWNPGGNTLTGLDRSFRLLPRTLELFGQALPVEPDQLQQDSDGKFLLPMAASGEPMQLKKLFLLGLDGPLDGGTLVRTLWEATGWSLTGAGRQRTAGALQALIPFVHRSGVPREAIVGAVQQALDTRTAP